MAKDSLTIKQEKYAQGLFAGLSQREAYKQAYDCSRMTDTSIDVEACKMAANPKIIQRLNELQESVSKANIWTVEEILKGIKEIANDPDARRFEKLKAYELGGKHLGMFTDNMKIDAKTDNLNRNIEIDPTNDDQVQKYCNDLAVKIEQRKRAGGCI